MRVIQNSDSNFLANTDDEFLSGLEGWITGFHGDVAPLSPEKIKKRVISYVNQEDQFKEKIGFLLSILGAKPKLGLDIGSSAGGLSVALAQHGIEMHGIEPSLAGVEVSKMRAQRRKLNNVSFYHGVGEHLPFAESHFDFVISLAVLEHVQDVDQVVSEALRVLKPGGVAYFEVPNNLYPFEGHYKMLWLPMMPKFLAKLYVKARGAFPNFLDHLHYMNRFIVMKRFRKAGFHDLKDLYADFVVGKAKGEPWASQSGRLSKLSLIAPVFKIIFGKLPTSWFINRAVYLIAKKPI